MDVAAAYQFLSKQLEYDPGKFYGNIAESPLGVGDILTAVRLPFFDKETAVFYTSEEAGYLLTHECDIDPANERPFSDLALVCPITPFEEWVPTYLEEHSAEELASLLSHIGRRNVSRVFYLPTLPTLQYGGLIYLNQITHTHVSTLSLKPAARVASVTAYGLQKLDHMLTNHLLRPKAVSLPLERW